MKATQPPQPPPTPAPRIGADVVTQHRPPAPTPAEHNATVQAARDAGTLPRAW